MTDKVNAKELDVGKDVEELYTAALKKDKQVQRLTTAVLVLAGVVGLLLAGNIALSLTTAKLVSDNRLENYLTDSVLVTKDTQTPIGVHRALQAVRVTGDTICSYSVDQLVRIKDWVYTLDDGTVRIVQISGITFRAGQFVHFNTTTGEQIHAVPLNNTVALDSGITIFSPDYTVLVGSGATGRKLLSRRKLPDPSASTSYNW